MLLRLAPWLFVSLWSTGYIAMKFAAPFAEPFTFLAIRFGLVVVLMVPFVLVIGAWRIRPRDAFAAAGVGALLHGIYLAGIFWALTQGMPAGVAAIIIALQPILSASVVAPFLGEQVKLRHWVGLLLGLAGSGLVLLPDLELQSAAISISTLIAGAIALASITLGTALQKSQLSHMDVRSALLPQYVGAMAVVGIAALLFEKREIVWSLEAIGAMLWLVLVLSIGAISLFLMLLRRNAVWRTVLLFYLIPPLTTVMAWLLFDEQLRVEQLGGMALVVLAIIVARPTTPSGNEK